MVMDNGLLFHITQQLKIQWHNSWSAQTKRNAVSYATGEGPWRSCSRTTLLITFWKVLKNNSWRSN